MVSTWVPTRGVERTFTKSRAILRPGIAGFDQIAAIVVDDHPAFAQPHSPFHFSVWNPFVFVTALSFLTGNFQCPVAKLAQLCHCPFPP
jgi:hypothetical protein